MKDKIQFNYTDGKAVCNIIYKGITFTGEAFCHPDDADLGSERVGLTIAETRANIKVAQFVRDHEIKNQLKILKHLYSNIKNSKYYNPISHESSMLRNQIKVLEEELIEIKNAIASERKFLKDYIDGKDKLFNRLRAKN